MTAPLHRWPKPNERLGALGQVMVVMRALRILLGLARKAQAAGGLVLDFEPTGPFVAVDRWHSVASAGDALADEMDCLGQCFWRDLGRNDMPDHRGRPIKKLRPSTTADAVRKLAALFENLIVVPGRALLAAAEIEAARRDHATAELLAGRAYASTQIGDGAAGVLPGSRPVFPSSRLEPPKMDLAS